MRIYKTKGFARFARREQIADQSLREAVDRAEKGLIDADLGGGIIKQRVARAGQGRSGGYRTFIAYRSDDMAAFLFGFAKSERANIDPQDLADLQILAASWLADAGRIARDVAAGILIEVRNDNEN